MYDELLPDEGNEVDKGLVECLRVLQNKVPYGTMPRLLDYSFIRADLL